MRMHMHTLATCVSIRFQQGGTQHRQYLDPCCCIYTLIAYKQVTRLGTLLS